MALAGGMKKRWMKVLCLGLILVMVVQNMSAAAADSGEPGQGNKTAGTEYAEDLIITTDYTISESITMADGKAIYVNSGSLTIEEGVIVAGDIYLEGKASMVSDGSILGTLTMNSAGVPAARVDYEDNLTQVRNLSLYRGYVEKLVMNGTGSAYIGAEINELIVSEQCSAELGVQWGSIQSLTSAGSGLKYFDNTHIDDVNLIKGEININSGSIVGHAKVSGGTYNNTCGARTETLVLSGDGYVSNRPADGLESGYIASVLIESGENNTRFENYGRVGSLVALSGNVQNSGYIKNALVSGLQEYLALARMSWVQEPSFPYSTQSLYFNGSIFNADKWDSDTNAKPGNVFINGADSMTIRNAEFQNLILHGSFGGAEVENVYLLNCYIDMTDVVDTDVFRIPDPTTFGLYRAVFSESFHELNEEWFDKLFTLAEKNSEIAELVKALVYTVDTIPSAESRSACSTKYNSAQYTDADSRISAVPLPKESFFIDSDGEERWFSFRCETNSIINLKLTSYNSLGFAAVVLPDGRTAVLSGNGTSDLVSVRSGMEGTGYLLLAGGLGGMDVSVTAEDPYEVSYTVEALYAARADETPGKVSEVNGNSALLTAYDLTTGKDVSELYYSDNKLYFPRELTGHQLQITADCRYGDDDPLWGLATDTKTITVGTDQKISFTCSWWGSYDGNFTESLPDARVYLYKENGTYLCELYTDGYSFWSDSLTDGAYTAIIIRDAGSSYRFLTIADYERYGLTEGEDYRVDHFTAQRGLISNYPNVTVPEAPVTEYRYLDQEVSGYYTALTTTVANIYIPMQLNYTVLEGYRKDVTVKEAVFELSESTVFLENSVQVNGKTAEYFYEDHVLTVPVNGDQNSISYCVEATPSANSVSTIATLKMAANGKSYSEHMGSAASRIQTLTLDAPSMANQTVVLSGYAEVGRAITVYDGTTIIGTTEAKKNGYWSGSFSLYRSEEGSIHRLSAALDAGTANEVRTPETTVYQSTGTPQIENFKLMYYEHELLQTIELSGDEFGKQKFTYAFWPGNPLTFHVQMSNSNLIDRLWIVSNEGGHFTLEGFYDEGLGCYVASGFFSSDENYLPGDFSIEYTFKQQGIEELKAKVDSFFEEKKNIQLSAPSDDLLKAYEDAETKVEYSYSSDDGSYECQLLSMKPEVEGDGIATLIVSDVYRTSIEESPLDLIADGYIESHDEDGKVSYTKMIYDEEDEIFRTISVQYDADTSLNAGILSDGIRIAKLGLTDSLPGIKLASSGTRYAAQENNPVTIVTTDLKTVGVTTIQQTLSEISNNIIDKIGDKKNWVKNPEGNLGYLKNLKGSLKGVRALSKQGAGALIGLGFTMKDIYDFKQLTDQSKSDALELQQEIRTRMSDPKCVNVLSELSSIDNELASCIKEIDALYWKMVQINLAVCAISTMIGIAVGGAMTVLAGPVGFAASILVNIVIGNIIEYIQRMMGLDNDSLEAELNQYNARIGSLRSRHMALKCNDDEPSPTPMPDKTPKNGTNEQLDPSGYVYEAVPSNRLAGVTATVYYRGEDEKAVQWDAEEYGEVNPQTTDRNGAYQWFVPKGEWQVKYELNGYETKFSEWLPVPPPQLEVNYGLVSYEAPVVTGVQLFENYCDIIFSKYVTVESVNDQSFTVKGAAGTIEALNAEMGDNQELLANRFRLYFTKELTAKSNYKVECRGAVSYAGTGAEDYSESVTCRYRINSVSYELPTYLPVGESVTIAVKVSSKGGFDEMQLTVLSENQYLTIDDISAVDSKGNATVTVTAKSSGMSYLTIGVDGTDIALKQKVMFARPNDATIIAFTRQQVDTGKNILLWLLLSGILCLTVAACFIIRSKKRRVVAEA